MLEKVKFAVAEVSTLLDIKVYVCAIYALRIPYRVAVAPILKV